MTGSVSNVDCSLGLGHPYPGHILQVSTLQNPSYADLTQAPPLIHHSLNPSPHHHSWLMGRGLNGADGNTLSAPMI